MENLQITAHLQSPIAVYDNYSPSLDGLLQYFFLLKQGIPINPNPTEADLIDVDLPLLKIKLSNDDWYWAVSSPHYQYSEAVIAKYRKRWDYQESNCNWGKKKAKVDVSVGHTKSYDLPLPVKTVSRIDWFAVGNAKEIMEIITSCKALGKKTSYGYGQVSQWEVCFIDQDYHLFRKDKLARPIPVEYAQEFYENISSRFVDCPKLVWSIKPPGWLLSNRRMCYLPKHNTVKI